MTKEELKEAKGKLLKLKEQQKKGLTGYPHIDKPWNKGHSYFERNPIIPNMSIYNAVRAINAFYGERYVTEGKVLKVKYKQLFADSVTISRAFKELGVKKGDIVTVSMPNLYQALAAFFACNRIGAVATFLNSSAPREEIENYLNLFESPILLNYDVSEEENINYKKNTGVKYIISLSRENTNNIQLGKGYSISGNKDLIDYNSLGDIAKYHGFDLPTNNGNDTALILFTSGSTGKPKAVELTNKNIISAGIYLKNSSNSKKLEGNKTLVCVPFMYPFGFSTSTLMTLMSSKTAILAPDISKDNISFYLKKQPNLIFGSPALLDLIMNNVPKDQDLSFVKNFISGGDFLTPSHAKRGHDFFEEHGAPGVDIGNGSGNAETVSCGTNHTGIEVRPTTAGKILTGIDAMIVDPETLEEKKYNEEGLECIAGEHVFKGYYKDPKRTADATFIKNGKRYFKTGSMGFIDEDGYFTLTSRESRFYILSTLNKVYCDYVQNTLSNLNEIKDCAVVKIPDEDMLYSNKIYIILNEKEKPSDDLKNELFKKFSEPITKTDGEIVELKWYEVPKYIEFVDELPRRKGTEKIDYTLLEKMAEDYYKQEKIKTKVKKL